MASYGPLLFFCESLLFKLTIGLSQNCTGPLLPCRIQKLAITSMSIWLCHVIRYSKQIGKKQEKILPVPPTFSPSLILPLLFQIWKEYRQTITRVFAGPGPSQIVHHWTIRTRQWKTQSKLPSRFFTSFRQHILDWYVYICTACYS